MKPSILVRCYINSWSSKKVDQGETQKVRAATGSKTVEAVKRLFGEGSTYDALVTKQGQIRNLFNDLTSPWDDRSWRILSAEGFVPFLDKVRKEIHTHDRMAEKFYQEYPAMVQEDTIRQGTLYNPEDYPSLADIQGRFKVSLFFRPVPQQGDFRVEMDPEVMKELQEGFQRDQQEKLSAAVSESYERIKGALAHLRKTLEGYGPGKRLFSSTLGNLLEIADALPGLNIAADPQLDKLAKEIRDSFGGESVETLRDDEVKRQDVAKRASNILDAIEALHTPTEEPLPAEPTPQDVVPMLQGHTEHLTEKEREILKRLGQ